MSSFAAVSRKERKRKVYAVRRHDRSLCTQKQPETAALRALKAATRESDPKGGQPALSMTAQHQKRMAGWTLLHRQDKHVFQQGVLDPDGKLQLQPL